MLSGRRPGRLAHHGDVVGVAAECLNVVVNPLRGGKLVEHGVVSRAVVAIQGLVLLGQLWVGQPAEAAATVVVVDVDDALVRHAGAVEQRIGCG